MRAGKGNLPVPDATGLEVGCASAGSSSHSRGSKPHWPLPGGTLARVNVNDLCRGELESEPLAGQASRSPVAPKKTLHVQFPAAPPSARLACLYLRARGAGHKPLENTMMTKWQSSALVLGLALSLGTPAFALDRAIVPTPDHHGHSGGAAPEVDPSLAVGGISFLAGSLVVLRSRLRK